MNNIQQLWFIASVASPTASVNASESVVVPRIPRTTAFCLLEKGPVMFHDVPKVRKPSPRITRDPSPVHRNKVAGHLNPCGEAEGRSCKQWPVPTAKLACILKVCGAHFHPGPEIWVTQGNITNICKLHASTSDCGVHESSTKHPWGETWTLTSTSFWTETHAWLRLKLLADCEIDACFVVPFDVLFAVCTLRKVNLGSNT